MLDPENQSLKNLLIAERLCSSEQLQEIEEEYLRNGKSFFQISIDFDIASEAKLLQMIAKNLGTEVISLTKVNLHEDIVMLVDPQIARMHGIIPISYDGYIMTVAASNALSLQVTEELRFTLNADIQVVIAPELQIEEALELCYPEDEESIQEVIIDIEEEDVAEYDSFSLEDAANKAPIIRYVDQVLYQAIKEKSSDIHFEPFEREFKIRYRIDGALYEMTPPPQSLAMPVISRLKIMSGLNISETRMPQDGRIQLKIAGKPVDLRVSTLPTAHGESVVLRILDRSTVQLELDSLGISNEILQTVNQMIHRPNGIFIVTGPTGSGKSTTLYSCLGEVNKTGEKILTAEDPVEYDIDGIIQVPINEAAGMTFAKTLKSFLRQDPDRIMVGEIRDIETAKMSIEASLTGHFVYSTLHTNDAAGAITRLIDMNIEPFLIASSLVGVLGQRLIRKICSSCKQSFTPNDDDLEKLDLEQADIGSRQFYYGSGCPGCNQTGYKGRKAISELLIISSQIKELIIEKAPTVVIREKARELGMRTLREDGIKAVLDGETTMEEIIKYT